MINRQSRLLAAACALLLIAGPLGACKQTLQNADRQMTTMFADANGNTEAMLDFLEGRVGPYDEYVYGVNWAAGAAAAGLYKPEHRFNDYLQKVGTTIALASHYPHTYAGYTFAVIDSDQRNAVAVPAGFIFMTRGLLGVVRSEDELAAVLAHEIAHHELRHNMLDVAAGKSYQVMDYLLDDSNQPDGEQLMEQMAIGYNERHELEADRRGIELLALAGYQPQALVRVLERLKTATGSLGGRGYPEARDELARQHIEDLGLPETRIPNIRNRRFDNAIAGFADAEIARN
jgi:predicted Zn-dependent protease